MKIDLSLRQAARDLAKWIGIIGAVVLAIGIVILVTRYSLSMSRDGGGVPQILVTGIVAAFAYWVGMGLWAAKSPPTPTGWSLRPFQKRAAAVACFFLFIYSFLILPQLVSIAPVAFSKMALRSLMVSQDSIFADSGIYARELSADVLSSQDDAVTVEIAITVDGWVGVASHAETDRTCATYVGSPPAGVGSGERQILCTRLPFRKSDAQLGLAFVGVGILLGLLGAFGLNVVPRPN